MRSRLIVRLAGALAGLNTFAALLTAQSQPGVAQVPTVTLDEAIRLALRVQPAVVQAQADLTVSSANRRQAFGNWLPTVTASTAATKASSTRFNPSTGQNVTVPAAWSYSGSVRASLELFDQGFRRVFQNRLAGANVARDEAALVNQKFQVTLQAKQAFFDAVAAEELERVTETRVQQALEQLKISKEKLAAGSAIRSDTLRATVSYGQAQLALLNARAQRATAEAALARLIGVEGSVRTAVDSSVMAVSALDTAAIRSEASRNAPGIAQAEAARRAADAQVNVSRAQYLPSVTATYSQTRSGTALDALTPGWSLGLSLSWTLFNGFSRETGLSQALANRDAAAAAEADARRQVNVQITQQLANLLAAQTQLGIALASQGAAEEDLRVQRERYRLGAATIVDVLTAQGNVDQSRVDAVTARRAYQVARANLEALVGRQL